ncbi:MAG: YwiC-like family protein [Nitrospinota bacterium]|nr:YwiC-like family protein [Nitrospinota bacterium]MDH5755979.1 YwiC-like family protein [Nitrospinota bacterium]
MPLYLNKPVIPKEHGAWPVLIVPMVAGSLAVRPDPAFLPGAMAALMISALCGFLAVSTLRIALNPPPGANRQRLTSWSVIYSLASAIPFAYLVLVADKIGLLWFIIPAAVLTAIYFWSSAVGTKRTLPFEIIGLGGLALSGPAAAYIQQGMVWPDGAIIYLFCLIWFTDRTFTARRALELMRKNIAPATVMERIGLYSSQYVIHGVSLLLGVVIIFLWGKPSGWLMMAPLLLATAKNGWDAAIIATPTDPMKLGFSEMRMGIGFCLLLIVMFRA